MDFFSVRNPRTEPRTVVVGISTESTTVCARVGLLGSDSQLVGNCEVEILNLYISDGHNYVGHHGRPPGTNAIREVDRIECVAGRGIRGDRYFDHKENFLGQITLFADEVYQALKQELGMGERSPSVFRRNVVTRGLDLNELIGQEFEIQGLRFRGTEECRPCYWMDQAVGPGAEDAMRTRGGLRAQILTDGVLVIDASRAPESTDS